MNSGKLVWTQNISEPQKEKIAGEEHKESAWFAAAALQVIDSLEIAVRYEAFDDDITGDQDGHLANRYSIGVN